MENTYDIQNLDKFIKGLDLPDTVKRALLNSLIAELETTKLSIIAYLLDKEEND